MATHQPLVLLVVAAACGIVVDRWLPMGFGVWAVAGAACLLAWSVNTHPGNRTCWWGSLLLLLASTSIAGGWHHAYWNWYGDSEIGRFAKDQSQPCIIEVELCSEPRFAVATPSIFDQGQTDPLETRFRARALRLKDQSKWREVSGNLEIVVHGRVEDWGAGDQVGLHGKLIRISPPTNPGQFDFATHYRRQRTLAFVHVYQPKTMTLLDRKAGKLSRWRAGFRQSLDASIHRHLAPRQAQFASAILLGNREQLSRDRKDRFVETGTVHLLAISGLHVGILAGAFLLLPRLVWFPRRPCLWLTIVFVVFYAWLVEFRSPATRASILIVLFCLARLWGERNFSMNLLALAAALVLLINPTDLFAIGPQLSFLAVATSMVGREHIFLSPSTDPLDRLIAASRPKVVQWFVRARRQLFNAARVSAAIWVVGLPLVSSQFHVITPGAMAINPVLLLPIATALYSGLALLLLAGWAESLAGVAGLGCEQSLILVESLVAMMHRTPGACFWSSGPPEWAVGLFYVGLVLFAVYPPTRLSRRWQALLLLAWLVLGWWLPRQHSNMATADAPMTCNFIDVGHGTSVLVQFPSGKTWLYDAGSFGAARYGAGNIASTLWYRNIQRIDTLVISHADVDHFNAASQLIQQFRIGRVLIGYPMNRSTDESVVQLKRDLDEFGIPWQPLEAGDRIRVGTHDWVQVLSPPRHGFEDNDNANSVVLLAGTRRQTVLLPGDLERSGMEALLQQPEIEVDVLLAPHHGSKYSRPQELLAWCRPRFVVVSGGDDVSDQFQSANSRDESDRLPPKRPYLWQTDQDGAIEVQLRPGQVKGRHWTPGGWSPWQEAK